MPLELSNIGTILEDLEELLDGMMKSKASTKPEDWSDVDEAIIRLTRAHILELRGIQEILKFLMPFIYGKHT